MIDIHTHTTYSADGRQSPEQLVEAAVKKGCKVLGFSEHLDYDYVANNLEVKMTDVEGYFNNAAALKEKFKGKITLLCGIEFGYDKGAENDYKNILKQYNFDYVINSVHVVKGKDCYFKQYFEGKTKRQAYEDYLNAVLQSVNAGFDYQIIGHIGYAVRNATYRDKYLYYGEFKTLIDEILTAVIKREKVLEVNTNIKYHRTKTLPDAEILQRYYRLGGRLVTFSSDCHSEERVCQGYRGAVKLLKNIGFDKLTYFVGKKPAYYGI
jgi:histidinol-phosphatase (PHP family)